MTKRYLPNAGKKLLAPTISVGLLLAPTAIAPSAQGLELFPLEQSLSVPGYGKLPNSNLSELVAPATADDTDAADAQPKNKLSAEDLAIVSRSPLNSLPLLPQRSAAAGTLQDSEAAELMVNHRAWNATAYRYQYHSTDSMERPSIDSALYIEPNTPWTGDGPRPIVAIAPGTQGAGEKCDPSLSTQTGLTISIDSLDIVAPYEVLPLYANLKRGAAIIMIDHHRNDQGNQEYVDNISSAQSLLDAVVAAQELGADKEAPVGIYGYSQGGSAAAAAAERAALYAPELNIVATSAGGPPSDLVQVLEQIDGTALTAVIGLSVNAILDKDPELRALVDRELNDEGRALLNQVGDYCAGGLIAHHAFETTEQYLAGERNLHAIIEKYPPIKKELIRQRVGNFKPAAPVFLYNGTHDDIIPVEQARQLRDDWTALGAELEYHEDPTPPIAQKTGVNHVAPMFRTAERAWAFLWARFDSR